MFIVPHVFDIFMHNEVLPRTGKQLGPKTGDFESFDTFDDVVDAFKKQLKHFMSLQAESTNIRMQIGSETAGDPIRSSLMEDAIKAGKDLFDRELPFDNRATSKQGGRP
jgi:formate C-acetyltransferase